MYCDYKISTIIDYRNQVLVNAKFYEGDYQDVTIDEVLDTEETENIYVRENVFYTCSLWFDKCPTLNDEIENKLLEILNEQKGNREVIE